MNSKLSSLLSRSLIDRNNGHRHAVLTAYAEKLRVSALPVEEREMCVNHKLADLLNHARIHVPRFRVLLGKQAAIDISNARAALASLPVMTRSDIQSDPQSFIAENAQTMFDDATGGSSGTPMRFKVDRATQIARESSLYWSDHLAGWNYGDRIAMLWGSDKDVKTASQEFRSRLRWCIDNRRWYNTFNMGEDQMARFHREMTRFRPHIIVAYAGSLDVYARWLLENGLAGKNGSNFSSSLRSTVYGLQSVSYPLTAIISSAEMLLPSTRELASQVFGKPVFDRYGNREFGAIATEDGQGDLLVNPTDMMLEVNESWELLVTYLNNRAMPFLRYNTGDVAKLTSTTRLQTVSGRISDTIRTASGNLVHGEYFTHVMYGIAGVTDFQFVQESPILYRLRLVGSGHLDLSQEVSLRNDILDKLGNDAKLTIEWVQSIPCLKSGKRQFTISMCAVNHTAI